MILFIALYMVSPYTDHLDKKRQTQLMKILFVVMVLCIGFRNPIMWIDTYAYVLSFLGSSTLASFSFNDDFYGYSEKGYYFLCVIIKTFSSSTFVYLTTIGFLSMLFFFNALRKYCLLPALGLCVYIARYMLARDMNQMRAGLAISIVMSFTYLLVSDNEKDKLKDEAKYVIVCWLASFIHTSMLAAIPIILFNHIKLSKKWIFIGIFLSFYISGVYSQLIMDFISQSDTIQDMATDYVDKEGENDKAYAADLTNPMIYYQCIILFVYTLMEKKLAPMSKYYYIFRDGYFMGTVILIVLCQYAVLSARVSTIFATFEVFMIPMIIKGLPKPYQVAAYIVLLAPMVVFFNYNMH